MSETLAKCKFNKWCCFCKNWYNPTSKGLIPKPGKDLFMVDKTIKCPCILRNNMQMFSFATCSKFERKQL